MRPCRVTKISQDHSRRGVRRLYDLAVSNINSDVTFVPNSQTRDFGDGINRSFFRGIFIHGVRTDVGHTVCTVVDFLGFGIKPAIAFNQPNTVCSPSAQPILTDEILMTADLVRVLFQLKIKHP